MWQLCLDQRDVAGDTRRVVDYKRWWDGPWPWLVYIVTYGIPWLWRPPSTFEFFVSAGALAIFLTIYFRSFHLKGKSLAVSLVLLTAIGAGLMPVGGGWSILAVYPAIHAGRLRPRRAAIWAIPACIIVFLITGLLSGQPLVWWLPSLMIPALIGGAVLSQEAFYDRTRALLATQEEVRRLASLAERERLARDVHDVIGRTLTLVALKADLVERLAASNSEAASKEARSIGDQARAGFTEMRIALDGHSRGNLASEFVASIATLEAAGIQTEMHRDFATISPGAEAILSMTLREAVTNVVRHACARRCILELRCHGEQAILTITDDGPGTEIVEGHGLTGMRHRLMAAGGALKIQSDGGTTLIASLPI